MKDSTLTSFDDLGLAEPLLTTLARQGYDRPTPIQAQAIPHILAGRDVLGIAQTGTGKTAAFALPILQRLAADRRPPQHKTCRALILSPTRELATQIAESFRTYGDGLKLSVAIVFGGVAAGAQVRALAFGVDILVATPGRLLDHVQTNAVRLDKVETFVLDEADQMLDMGFIQPIRRLVRSLPARRQNLFFSATMPGEIGTLAGELLHDPQHVAVTPVSSPVERIDQRVIYVDTQDKRHLLAKLLREDGFDRTLVFTRTKHGADRVVRHLAEVGVASAAIHGNKSQPQRERALAEFKSGKAPVLIATDIAARGIDVDGVSHVVNFDLPNIPESYVHRIGRTARAGASGTAISFCAGDERAYLKDIESLIKRRLPVSDERGRFHEKRPEPGAPRPETRPESRNDGRGEARGGKPRGQKPQGRQQQGQQHQGQQHQGQPSRGHAAKGQPSNGQAASGQRHQDQRFGGSRGPAPTRDANNRDRGDGGEIGNVAFLRRPGEGQPNAAPRGGAGRPQGRRRSA